MTWRPVAAALVLCLTLGAFAQSGAPPKLKNLAGPSAQADTRPVTVGEAQRSFNRMRSILSAGVEATLPKTALAGSARSPVTREQVVNEFAQLYAQLGPRLKFTPTPLDFDNKVFKIAPSQKSKLARLVKIGSVGRVAPLATGPLDTLTVHEFGDALGLFIARMAELTHMPSTKWTPILEPGSNRDADG